MTLFKAMMEEHVVKNKRLKKSKIVFLFKNFFSHSLELFFHLHVNLLLRKIFKNQYRFLSNSFDFM